MAGAGKCLLVTGPPLSSPPFCLCINFQFTDSKSVNLMQGVGKTTLIVKVFETLKSSYPNLKIQGFYTSNPLSLSISITRSAFIFTQLWSSMFTMSVLSLSICQM